MSVYEHLKHLNTSSKYQSIDAELSGWMLAHFSVLGSLTLSQIASSTFIAKGSVSKFISRLTSQGTFHSFQNAVACEYHEYVKRVHQALGFSSAIKRSPSLVINPQDISLLADALARAERVIFIADHAGSVPCEAIADVLLACSINTKVVGAYYTEDLRREIECMNTDGVLVFVSDAISMYEWLLRLNLEMDLMQTVDSTKARIFAVGRGRNHLAGITGIELSSSINHTNLKAGAIAHFASMTIDSLLKHPSQRMDTLRLYRFQTGNDVHL